MCRVAPEREPEPACGQADDRRPLSVLSVAGLTPRQLAALTTIADYDLSPVSHRLAKKRLLPADCADDALREFQRFLGLHALADAPVPIHSEAVDLIWHTAIMFTRLYDDICDLAFGRFIHHRPTSGHEYAEPDAAPDARARFFAFRDLYEQHYGPINWLWLIDRPWASHDHPPLGSYH